VHTTGNVRESEFFLESHFSEKKCIIIRKISTRMATGAVNVYMKQSKRGISFEKKNGKG
jgi:hypothetical protein